MKNILMKPKDKNMENEYANPSMNDMEQILIANITKELRKQLKGLIFVDYKYDPTIMAKVFKVKYVNDNYKFIYMFYDVEKWISDGTITNNICSEFISKLRQDILQKYFW